MIHIERSPNFSSKTPCVFVVSFIQPDSQSINAFIRFIYCHRGWWFGDEIRVCTRRLVTFMGLNIILHNAWLLRVCFYSRSKSDVRISHSTFRRYSFLLTSPLCTLHLKTYWFEKKGIVWKNLIESLKYPRASNLYAKNERVILRLSIRNQACG